MENETEVYLNKLHPAKQLDEVLKCLYPDKPPTHRALEIIETLKLKAIITKESEVIFILEKLILDRMATREIRPEKIIHAPARFDLDSITSEQSEIIDVAYYLITFEGKVRIDYENGYQGMLNEKMETENQVKISQEQERQNQISFQAFQKGNDEKMVAINNRMVTLTVWLVFGTLVAAVYYFDQICKEHHWLWHH